MPTNVSFTISRLGLRDLIGADVAAASVLISMGALLGRTTWVQLLLMGFIEILIFSANEYLQVEVFQVKTRIYLLASSLLIFIFLEFCLPNHVLITVKYSEMNLNHLRPRDNENIMQIVMMKYNYSLEN